MSSLETVNSFLKAAAARDYESALPLLAEDVEYQNMPLPAVTGRQAVKDTLEALMALTTESEWIVHRELADGNVVMNERTDRFVIAGKWVELPVAGVFVLNGGVISLWRDYFDLPTITNAMTAGAAQ